MKAVRKRRSSAATRYRNRIVLTSLVLAIIVISLIITANDTLQWSFLPTWDSVFTMLNLREKPVAEGELKVTFLDVGNADSILLQCQDKAALIDAGENNDGERVVTALKSAGVNKLDYVIATHADADHIGGMDDVINTFPIDTFLMSFMPEAHTPTTRTYERMLTALVDRGVDVTEAEHGDRYAFGTATITILSGISDYTETNDQSVVCRVTHGENDFVFMGDAGKQVEREILQAVPDLKADVLKVGHHGSRSSSDRTFLRCVEAQYAVITCGYNNTYGHPHEETLQALQDHSVKVYRSDVNGKIVMTSDGQGIAVKTER